MRIKRPNPAKWMQDGKWAGCREIKPRLRSRQKFFLDIPFYRTHLSPDLDGAYEELMKRSILALIAGLVLWVVVASLLNRGLRVAFAGYAAAEPAMSFTPGMKLARLLVGALASL